MTKKRINAHHIPHYDEEIDDRPSYASYHLAARVYSGRLCAASSVRNP